jgi:hypothetical protein
MCLCPQRVQLYFFINDSELQHNIYIYKNFNYIDVFWKSPKLLFRERRFTPFTLLHLHTQSITGIRFSIYYSLCLRKMSNKNLFSHLIVGSSSSYFHGAPSLISFLPNRLKELTRFFFFLSFFLSNFQSLVETEWHNIKRTLALNMFYFSIKVLHLNY